jgi:hypothetical protein
MRNTITICEGKRMGYTDEGSNRFSFFSFVLSILGFFFLSFYGIGAIVGIIAVVLSFLAEDILKEKSTFQYLAIIVAVVDILGAIVGWNIIMKA